MDGISIGHQFVEYFRTVREFFVVRALLIQQSDGLTITALGIVKLLSLPVQVTQSQQQHTLLNAVSY